MFPECRALARRSRPNSCGYILMPDQSDTGSVGIFSCRINQTQEVWVYSHVGPIAARAPTRSAAPMPYMT
eukprot:1276736-Pyramimonas_sp.AAC.1